MTTPAPAPLALALRFVRAASGADRISLVVVRPQGGSELYGIDAEAEEHRELSIVPTQLFGHFDGRAGAEVRRDLAASPYDSDRSLARKGFGEVVRAPLHDAAGRTIGMLNVIRVQPSSGERDRAFIERVAAALAALVQPA